MFSTFGLLEGVKLHPHVRASLILTSFPATFYLLIGSFLFQEQICQHTTVKVLDICLSRTLNSDTSGCSFVSGPSRNHPQELEFDPLITSHRQGSADVFSRPIDQGNKCWRHEAPNVLQRVVCHHLLVELIGSSKRFVWFCLYNVRSEFTNFPDL